ncbi:MAG: DUF1223 domain-containing protein [Rudaea sp.]|nr:DUF1223 domain-containing protein [Rudaea sp.]
MREWICGTLIACALISSSRADCGAQSAATHPHLVELYTSEGCSSCPPADAWLRNLPSSAGVVALAFHVDYWDSLGWRDHFADARYSDRQRQQARRDASASVYTPQVVLDGRSWQGWFHGAGFPAAERSRIAIKISAVRAASSLQLHLESTAPKGVDVGAYRNFVALTEDGLSTEVRAGENRGVTLHHDHVVRNIVGPLPASGSDVRIDIPAETDASRSTLVAFTQDPRSGDVAQVLSLPLVQCRVDAD